MSSTHSPEFKAQVALEAISQVNDVFTSVAKKHGVTKQEVETWVSELKGNASAVFEESVPVSQGEVFDVEIPATEEFAAVVKHGVEGEGINLTAVYKWSGIGVVLVVVSVVALIFFAQYAYSNAEENVNVTSSYYEIEKLREEGEAILNSYGIVDLEEGVYRIPIDEAINKMAEE